MTRTLSSPRPLHKDLGYTTEWEGVAKGTGGHQRKSEVVPKGLCAPRRRPWAQAQLGLDLLNEGATFLPAPVFPLLLMSLPIAPDRSFQDHTGVTTPLWPL